MITSAYLPATGRFLVSEPFMDDLNFQRTVVLIADHQEHGSLGFVMNRPFHLSLHEILPDFSTPGFRVLVGGPVEPNTLHYVHRFGEQVPGSVEVLPGLFWGGEFHALRALIVGEVAHPTDVQFFIGYSGWASGQLEMEIQRKSWIVVPGSTHFMFRGNNDDLWREVLNTLGDKYRVIANYPVDPRLN